DKIPPEIIELYPEDGTTNFDEEYFEIGFSEYVDKRSVQDAVFISPAIEGDIEYDWSGKYLRVNFPGKLREDATYVVTIGTDVADYNNKNRMAEAYTFTFATGNEIDRRIITGRVYDSKAEDVMLFAYKLTDTTTNPLAYKPDYISQAGKKGDYKIMGLAEGDYRIFAVQDEYRDLLFQPVQDRIGIPSADIHLTADDTLHKGLNFFITSADTVRPRLISAVMTDEHHILVSLSKESELYDQKKVNPNISAENFSLIDSATGKIAEPLYAYKGNTKSTEFVLVVPKDFPGSDEWYLIADTLKDNLGNFYANDFTSLTISSNPDTTKPNLYKTIPPKASRDADYQSQDFYFYFDDAFNRETAETGITFKDTLKRDIKFNLTFIDDASFKVTTAQKLEPQKDYIIALDLNKFEDASGNSYDSVYRYNFRTISGLDFTGISGKLFNADFSSRPVLVLEGVDNKDHIYNKTVADENFSFERVNAGKYILWCYYDKDSSNSYSYGSADPFKYSEEFFFYRDTLALKPRWTQTDINFLLDEK
ncbi:MAG: hypothetical protein EHM47_11785, partial [Ignavibacteriales bacterium]